MSPQTRRRSTYTEESRKGGIGKLLIVAAVVLAVVIGGAFLAERFISGMNPAAEDYEGTGAEPVTVSIPAGSNGTHVANILFEHDVIASPEALIEILIQDPSITLQPGSFELRTQMSAQAALDVLTDPDAVLLTRVTIPEGFVLDQVLARLAESTGLAIEEFEKAAQDPSAFGVSAESPSLEGWLFPATYEFDPAHTPQDILQTMVDRMRQALAEHGVAEPDHHETLTFAALIQREGRSHEDFTKMARVFLNRIDDGMLLQSDATVAYGTGHLHVVTTTPEERADPGNLYNTYVHAGLPPGPIGAPGDDAINAALAPADGAWLYFVTVNPESGETVFSNTYGEHLQAVERFQEWLRANPGWGS